MAINYSNATSTRLSVADLSATVALTDPVAWANFDSIDFEHVQGVTGITKSDASTEKDVTDLGSKTYKKMVKENIQISLAIVVQFDLDPMTDEITADTGLSILKDASIATGMGNVVWVRYDGPKAAKSAAVAANNNDPQEGRCTIMMANVSGGDLGLGGGANNGGIEESAFTLKSFGEIYRGVEVS